MQDKSLGLLEVRYFVISEPFHGSHQRTPPPFGTIYRTCSILISNSANAGFQSLFPPSTSDLFFHGLITAPAQYQTVAATCLPYQERRPPPWLREAQLAGGAGIVRRTVRWQDRTDREGFSRVHDRTTAVSGGNGPPHVILSNYVRNNSASVVYRTVSNQT